MPGRLMGLPICSTTIVFLSAVLAMFPYLSRAWRDLRLGRSAVAGAVSPARHDLAHLLAATRRDAARAILMAERIKGGAHHVVGVRAAERFRHHVLDAEGLEHGTHGAAGDDAGARRGCPQDHPARAMLAGDVVMQRAALAERHLDEIALGGFRRLADRLRHLARLAMTEADAALLVADDDERGEAAAPAALHHLGDAIDMHELVDELAVALAIVAVPAFAASAAFAFNHDRSVL